MSLAHVGATRNTKGAVCTNNMANMCCNAFTDACGNQSRPVGFPAGKLRELAEIGVAHLFISKQCALDGTDSAPQLADHFALGCEWAFGLGLFL